MRSVHLPACPLNKLFKVFYPSFLYFNLFLQIYDFNFELCLLILVGLAHHGKAVIVQLALGIVLVDFDLINRRSSFPICFSAWARHFIYTLTFSSYSPLVICSSSIISSISSGISARVSHPSGQTALVSTSDQIKISLFFLRCCSHS